MCSAPTSAGKSSSIPTSSSHDIVVQKKLLTSELTHLYGTAEPIRAFSTDPWKWDIMVLRITKGYPAFVSEWTAQLSLIRQSMETTTASVPRERENSPWRMLAWKRELWTFRAAKVRMAINFFRYVKWKLIAYFLCSTLDGSITS